MQLVAIPLRKELAEEQDAVVAKGQGAQSFFQLEAQWVYLQYIAKEMSFTYNPQLSAQYQKKATSRHCAHMIKNNRNPFQKLNLKQYMVHTYSCCCIFNYLKIVTKIIPSLLNSDAKRIISSMTLCMS